MIDVNGVVSLLDAKHATQLKDTWLMLADCCRLSGKNAEMPPHFTWQVVERYDLDQFEPLLSALAKETSPFTVRTSGVGIFSGRSPILYIPVIKDAHLLHLHEQIWLHSQCCARNPNSYYAPDNWMPHITLVAGDVDAQKLSCALEILAFETFEWEIRVDNLALLCPEGGAENFNLLHIPLGGRSSAS